MTMNRLRALTLVFPALWLGVGCGSGGDSGGEADDDVGTTEEALAPAGSNAQVVSNTIATSLFPGERRLLTVTMKNTGAVPGTNNWTTANPPYALSAVNTSWGWSYSYIPAAVAVGGQNTFPVVVTAPPANTNFAARMSAVGLGVFGDTLTVPVTINNTVTPQYNCTYVSGVPATMAPNETRAITITVRNTGFATWPAANFKLVSKDANLNFWSNNSADLKVAVPPNGTTSFTFNIKAPAAAGTYPIFREMKDYTAIGDFRTYNYCVQQNIVVNGATPLDSQVVSTTFPSVMGPGQVKAVDVVMKNTGTDTWTNDGSFILYSLNDPIGLWGLTQKAVTAVTTNGQNTTISFNITAPAAGGTYAHHWQLRHIAGQNQGFFGAIINLPVTVDPNQPVPYASQVVSQGIPALVTVGTTNTFTVTMKNTGTQPWNTTNFMLYTVNSPVGLWTRLQTPLNAGETIAAGASRTFSFPTVAPSTPGTYASQWRMREATSVGVFGTTAVRNVVVTRCGNSVVDAGEQCDDGNLVNGDDCSDTCQFEQIKVDPSSTASDRTIRGTGAGAQLSPVTVGDITGDGLPEVLVAQTTPAPPPGSGTRAAAGSVYGFSGTGFLNGSSTFVPGNSGFQISGADRSDLLAGVTGGRMVIGNVAGDSINDLLVSAAAAAGTGNTRIGAGEVYVILGSSTLGTAGLIDLVSSPLPARVVSHITGAAGDGLTVLTTGDLTGDGKPDLVLGAPGRNAIFVIPGPVSGEIDMTAPPTGTAVITGLGIGGSAAVGDLNNDGKPDLLFGSSSSSPGGRNQAGAAFAKFGPIAGAVDTSLAAGATGGPSVVWFGKSAFDRFGGTVAIGNVTGTAQNEALIGAVNYIKGSNQVGAVTVWSAITGTYDLNAGAVATTTILGAERLDNCGTALAVGRVDGDTYDDIVFACSAADGPGNTRDAAGEINVLRGRATFPVTWDITTRATSFVLYGADVGGAMGRHIPSLAVADIDHDGFADICGGAYNGLNSGVKTGRLDCISSPY
jgi:cysteine-rich repeat protein